MSCVSPFSPNCSAGRPRRAVAAVVLLTPARGVARACAGRPADSAGRGIRAPPNPIAPKPAAPRQTHRHRQCCRRRSGRSGAAEEPHRQGDRQREGSREIGRRHFQPRAVPAAEGRRQIDGIAAACGGKARFGRAGDDHRLRFVVDAGLRHDVTGIHLSQPARQAAAPAISERRHHRPQSRQGRRRRAGNDEAAADRGDRHEAGSGDLAGRHQCGAAQSRSRRDRDAGRGRRRAHSGGRRRSRAGRSAIFSAG